MARLSRALEKAIFRKDEGICRICGRKVEFDDGEVDHILPSSKGGDGAPENLQWTCHRCNKIKSNKLSNEQVRRLLQLPEKFEDLLELKNKEKTIVKLPKEEIHDKLPVFSQTGLDKAAIEKNIAAFQESYQKETIIPEICDKIAAVDKISKEFTNISVHLRMPRKWFMPYEVTKQTYFNEPIFRDVARGIAYSEREYIESTILNAKIPRLKVAFSPKGIRDAVRKMEGNGITPNIIVVPIPFWTKIHHWSNEAHIAYDPFSSSNLSASLVFEDFKLKMIHPLGKFPKGPLLFSNQAISWIVRRYPNNCASYIVFGNHLLYPLKYTELLAGTLVKNELIPEGISILNFRA